VSATGPSTHEVQTRWQDLDALGHVNHNVVLTYLEEGRDAFLAERGIGRHDYVVGRCNVDYLAEIDPAQRSVSVECAAAEIGRSSLTTRERIVGPEGEVLVEAAFGLVLWDSERRRSRPLTDAERNSLAGAEARAGEARDEEEE
jgi:acyl-CoA thioester hydrolase